MAKNINQTEVSAQLKMEKKLRKRLQEAREVQAEALERFKRAEARLEKRIAQTQNLEARLAHVQQQLGILQTPQVSTDQIAQTLPIPNDEDTQTAEPQPETMQTLTAEDRIFLPALPPAEAAMMEWLANPLPAEVELELSGIFAMEQNVSAETVEASEADEPASEDVGIHDENSPSSTAIVSPDEANGLAKIARAVAETAENAARLAIERAVVVAARLEQMGSGRHLIQELEQTQSEADRASAIAQQTQRAAEDAEHLAAETAMQASAIPDTETPLSASEEVIQEEVAEELALATLEEMALEEIVLEEMIREEMVLEEQEVSANMEEMTLEEQEIIADVEEMALEEQEVIANVEEMTLETAPVEENLQEIHLPLPEQVEGIEDIEEEEAMVEAITAKLIADAVAAAAAEAEALAEASSSRTREARRLAVEADRALDNVYAAFLDGSMPEDEAQTRLMQAEREATRAHAMLADAEAAEEEAINAARNAEADAEVAESMAFASNDIAEHHFDANIVPALTDENELSDNSDRPDIEDIAGNAGNVDNAHNTNTVSDVDTVINENNTDATVKMRKMYPRQPM